MSDELYNLLCFIIPAVREIQKLPELDYVDGVDIFRGEVVVNYWTKDIELLHKKHKFKPAQYAKIVAELRDIIPDYDEDDDDSDYLFDKDIDQLEVHWSRRKLIDEFLTEAA